MGITAVHPLGMALASGMVLAPLLLASPRRPPRGYSAEGPGAELAEAKEVPTTVTPGSGSIKLRLLALAFLALAFGVSPTAAHAGSQSPVLTRWQASGGADWTCMHADYFFDGRTLSVEAGQTNHVSFVQIRTVFTNTCNGQVATEVTTERIHWHRDAQGNFWPDRDYTVVCYTSPDGATQCVRYRYKATPGGAIEIARVEPL